MQTAHCYRCTDKWKEGGVVSHEINKRGREKGRREAPSIYNSISPSLPFSAAFLSTSFGILLLLFEHVFSVFLPGCYPLVLAVLLLSFFLLGLIHRAVMFVGIVCVCIYICVCVPACAHPRKTVNQGSSGHLLEPGSFTYSQSHKGRGTQRKKREKNGREQRINLSAAGLRRKRHSLAHTPYLSEWHLWGELAWARLLTGSKQHRGFGSQCMGMQIEKKPTPQSIYIQAHRRDTWESSHTQKSSKLILFLTKQTGSIKMDNPTSSQRQGDGGLGIILTTRTESLPRVLPSQQS